MEEQKDRGFKQEPIAAAHHGTLVDVCNWVQLAFRLVALFGEPAKWVVKEIANAWDLYSTSPQDEAHKAFAQKVDEIGQRWEDTTKKIILAKEQEFGKSLGVGVIPLEKPKPPIDPQLREFYIMRENIKTMLAALEARYTARLYMIEEEYLKCLRRAYTYIQKVACENKKKVEIEKLKREYNPEKQVLLARLEEINRAIATLK